jgi:hypothetical protein
VVPRRCTIWIVHHFLVRESLEEVDDELTPNLLGRVAKEGQPPHLFFWPRGQETLRTSQTVLCGHEYHKFPFGVAKTICSMMKCVHALDVQRHLTYLTSICCRGIYALFPAVLTASFVAGFPFCVA